MHFNTLVSKDPQGSRIGSPVATIERRVRALGSLSILGLAYHEIEVINAKSIYPTNELLTEISTAGARGFALLRSSDEVVRSAILGVVAWLRACGADHDLHLLAVVM